MSPAPGRERPAGAFRCAPRKLPGRAASALSAAIVTALTAGIVSQASVPAPTAIRSRMTLQSSAIRDQDDMCIWLHPTDRSLSTIITSDKTSRRLFVYDLKGRTLQALPVAGKPGNIDVRYGFVLRGRPVDIVAFNDRRSRTIEIYRVDPVTRRLARVDDGAISTRENYGMCLYRSPASGAFYAFTTAKDGGIEQFELRDKGGKVAAKLVRAFDLGDVAEGCVCDDETGFAYFAEENVGIWKVGADPNRSLARSLIARTGDTSGLTADVEGLTIYYAARGRGYLIASSQGSNAFKVYEREPPHRYVKTFSITGVTATDGIDVTNVGLGPSFRAGIFTAHNASPKLKTIEVCAYQDLGLPVDTLYWHPLPPGTPGTP